MESLQFLEAFHPEGPWVLTAINPEDGSITTQTFGPRTRAEAQMWIGDHNGVDNMYFNVNRPTRKLTKKASRDDIVYVPWFHVDIDARAGEPLGEELERIREMLADCPVIEPTFLVFSGGGYQAFWKLAEPLHIKHMEDALEAARYNKQLELILGGDNCHNIDRIMRLPGTLNIPNARKREKGRTEAEAYVVDYQPDNVYALTCFSPAAQVQGSRLSPAELSATTGNVKRLDSVDELDAWPKIPALDRVKIAIVNGNDPDNPKAGDNSRSAWLFDVICQLVRGEVPDEVIYSIVTDPDFAISSSVLDKGSLVQEYAMRQISRAKEEVEEPWLRKMNDKYMVIGNLGGKCRVVEEVYDPMMKRKKLTKQTFNDFRNRYCNQTIQVGKSHVGVGHWWLQHPDRRQFEYITFQPGRSDPEAYNLWQGFACDSLPGENHLPFLNHIRHNICRADPSHYDYVVSWRARAVQKPDTLGETAIVLRGKSGTGKSFFAKHFGRLFGRHFLQVSDAKHLVGAFNAHLRDCVVLFGDEAFYAGDKKHESVLKTLITEEQRVIEQKGVDAEPSPNFTHLILASNADWVVPTGPTERRFLVLDVGDEHKQDVRYFGELDKKMQNGGMENLLYYLLNLDISGFNVRNVPQTKALMDQKLHSLTPFQEWWHYRLKEGALLSHQDEWESTVSCEQLHQDYLLHVRQFQQKYIGNPTRLGRFLSTMCPEDFPVRRRMTSGNSRPYFYIFPELAVCRAHWEELFGPTHWPKEQ